MLSNEMRVVYTPQERAVVDKGRDAHRHMLRTIDYWIDVGHAMNVLASKADLLGKSGFTLLQVQEGFVVRDGQPINKALVSRAREMAKHETEVQAWHAALPSKQQQTWNNPHSVFSHCPIFGGGKKTPKPKPKPAGKQASIAEAALRQSLSEAHAANEKLATMVAELRMRADTANTPRHPEPVRDEVERLKAENADLKLQIAETEEERKSLTLYDHLLCARLAFDDDILKIPFEVDGVVNEIGLLYEKYENFSNSTTLEWHSSPSRVTGHRLHFDNDAGWEESRYVITPEKSKNGKFSHYLVEAGGQEIDTAKTLDAAKAVAQEHIKQHPVLIWEQREIDPETVPEHGGEIYYRTNLDEYMITLTLAKDGEITGYVLVDGYGRDEEVKTLDEAKAIAQKHFDAARTGRGFALNRSTRSC